MEGEDNGRRANDTQSGSVPPDDTYKIDTTVIKVENNLLNLTHLKSILPLPFPKAL